MDRFAWSDGLLSPTEIVIIEQEGVRLYDGEDKTSFENGTLVLTSHRILWKHSRDKKCILSMPLSYVIYLEEQPGSFTKSAKTVAHLNAPPGYKPPGPNTSSKYSYVRFSFKNGGQPQFQSCLSDTIAKRSWEGSSLKTSPAAAGSKPVKTKELRAGIVGIERKIEQKNKETKQNISVAFEDLSKLMDKAKEMVKLSKVISNKIKEKQGGITEDETVRFKAYLLSLGIPDPVTRETHGTGSKYFHELARQVAKALEDPLKECGGMMTLTDVYCRINRARGMELLSPEDLVNACRQMENLGLPVRLQVFDSGVMVLQLQSHNDKAVIQSTATLVEENSSLTADELSRLVGISVVLSKERLLSCEKEGKVCRDDTVEGLRFFTNLFLNPPEEYQQSAAGAAAS